MSNAPTTTLRVSFGQSTGSGASYLSAELDSREDGLNAGNTQFVPGNVAWFLVHKGANVQIDGVESSAGTASLAGQVTYVKTEEVVFEGGKTASLSMPSQGISGVKWLGRNLGGLVLGDDGQTVTASTEGVAVAKVSYSVMATTGSLTSPSVIDGETEFSIAVIVTGSVAAA
jgi:hypothetical protein